MNARPALGEFVERFPDYRTTEAIDALRSTEYGRLDRDGHIYLDYTGGSLYADSQVRAHADLLRQGIFGNPHSGSLSSIASTSLVEDTRKRILRFFNAAPATIVVGPMRRPTGSMANRNGMTESTAAAMKTKLRSRNSRRMRSRSA